MTEPGSAPSAVTTPDPAAPTDAEQGPAPAAKAAGGKPAGSTAAATKAPAETKAPAAAKAAATKGTPGFTLLVLTLLWLAVIMFVANAATLRDTADAGEIVGSATLVQGLPNILSASLLAGLAAGLVARGRFAREAAVGRRIATGAVAGLAAGLLPGVLTVLLYGTQSQIFALGVTIALAAAIGGAVGAASPPAITTAATTAILTITILLVVLGAFFGTFRSLLSDDSTAARLAAAGWVAFTYAITAGIVAGLVSYLVLRRHSTGPWPLFAAAGAAPGLFLLASWVLTRVGGGPLIAVVASFSENDAAFMTYAANSGLSTALVVLFVGAITAIVAVGRSIKRA